jgi:hypothetical protein
VHGDIDIPVVVEVGESGTPARFRDNETRSGVGCGIFEAAVALV